MKLDIDAMANEAWHNIKTATLTDEQMVALHTVWNEHFARLIVERCADECDRRYMGDNNREDMEARNCAKAIRSLLDDK